LIGGDLNTIINESDTTGELEIKPYITFLTYMITDLSLIDPHEQIWEKKLHSHFQIKPAKRLDWYLISSNLRNRMIEYNIEPNSFSDHDAITLKLDIGGKEDGGKEHGN